MHTSFSHKGICDESARLALERRYAGLLEETSRFSRQHVSYQGNKRKILHSWIKYREGFSAQLVASLIHDFSIQPGDTILEPFSGSATTLLVAKSMGINAVGIELLPVCQLAWEAKSRVADYDLDELEQAHRLIKNATPVDTGIAFPHLAITESAFAPDVERELMFFTQWVEDTDLSSTTRTLIRLALTSILEGISYTRKDGQYLRWDYRAAKVQRRNEERLKAGRKPIQKMDKGRLPGVRESSLQALRVMMDDIRVLQRHPLPDSQQRLIEGSALTILPTLQSEQFAGVITSPPYCNRYDYTRTYALELAYLGVGEDGIRRLRHSQLSCTVENRSKVESLRQFYESIGAADRYEAILNTVQHNPVFQEIKRALQIRWGRGEINNQGILPMVEGYFTELTFVFAEILRTTRSGARVAFVNDNVRYGGEIIPVDLLTTDLACQLGFEPVVVYVLPKRKGNSSQQMGRFGREPLRKSITIWKKP